VLKIGGPIGLVVAALGMVVMMATLLALKRQEHRLQRETDCTLAA
jgi:hypothetical protein